MNTPRRLPTPQALLTGLGLALSIATAGAAATAAASPAAPAAPAKASTAQGRIEVGQPRAQPTVAGQSNGGAYLTLVNKGGDDRLLGARTARAAAVELHSMRMDGDVMRMHQVPAIEIPAGQTVALKSGGWHLMFVGLKQPLRSGESFPLTLLFEKAGELTVDMKVRPAGEGGPMGGGAAHKH